MHTHRHIWFILGKCFFKQAFRDLEMSLRLTVDFLTYSGGFSGVELFDFVYCLLLDGIVHAVKIK